MREPTCDVTPDGTYVFEQQLDDVLLGGLGHGVSPRRPGQCFRRWACLAFTLSTASRIGPCVLPHPTSRTFPSGGP